VWRILEVWQYLWILGVGLYTLLCGIFPPTPAEDPDFYHWEVDEKDSFTGDHILGQGMMSPYNARLVNIVIGSVCVIAATLAILYHFKMPPFAPDNF
jgi:hypothetical protein